MTTRLSQRKVKASDPAYQNLREELSSRLHQSGSGGYTLPLGGIPRSDLTADVQTALSKAEDAYIKPVTGILLSDLDSSIIDSLVKADTAYQKPIDGISAADLSVDIQERLNDFSNFYVVPVTGIPYVDLDTNLKGLVDKGISAYQKPEDGIPALDLNQAVQDALDLALTAYQKPAAGISYSDLGETITGVLDGLQNQITLHTDDSTIHITDHANLIGVGSYSHPELDFKIDEHELQILKVLREIEKARDGFRDLDERITSSLFRPNQIVIEGDAFAEGTFENLLFSEDQNLTYGYTAEAFPIEYYDMRTTTGYENSNLSSTQPANEIDFYWDDELLYIDDTKIANKAGVKIQGYLYAPVTGNYRFGIQASGDYTLGVAGKEIKVPFSSPTVLYSNEGMGYFLDVNLIGGRMYPFILFGKNLVTTGSMLRVSWKRPNQESFEILNSDYFSIDGFGESTMGVYTTKLIPIDELSVSEWSMTADYSLNELDMITTDVTIEQRQSDDLITFTAWTVYQNGAIIEEDPARYIQFRFTFDSLSKTITPILRKITLDYLSYDNAYFQEVELARAGYLSLDHRLDTIHQLLQETNTTATQLMNAGTSGEMLGHFRFGYVDVNMLRLHWFEQHRLKETRRLLPTGFTDDYNDGTGLESSFTEFEIKDSRVYLNPNKVEWDTDTDWMGWNRVNCSPESETLKMTFVANDQNTGPSFIDLPTQNIDTTSQKYLKEAYFFQKIRIEDPNLFSITKVSALVQNYEGGYGHDSSFRLYITIPDADGKPNFSKLVSLGSYSIDGTKTFWVNAYANYPISSKDKEIFIGIRGLLGYGGGGVNSSYGIRLGDTTSVPTSLQDQDGNPYGCYLDGNYVANRTLIIKVQANQGYHTEADAEKIYDFGIETNFINPEIDMDNKDGIIEIQYASSMDGVTYTDFQYDLGTLANGRFLKTKIHMARTTSNQSPEVKRLAIRYVQDDVRFQTKPVEVETIPTHAILDVMDSGNDDIRYEISRDNGITFIPITPRKQTDLRTAPVGRTMVIRMISPRDYQDDEVWIEYLGLQCINTDNPLGGDGGVETNYPSVTEQVNDHESRLDTMEPVILDTKNRIDRLSILLQQTSHKVVYLYDSVGRIESKTYKNMSNQVLVTVGYEYDSMHRESKETQTFAGGTVTIIEYIYDTEDRLAEENVTHTTI